MSVKMIGDSMNITKLMTELVFQVAIILFAAKVGGMIMKKMKMPSVLGELLIGILIGSLCFGWHSFSRFSPMVSFLWPMDSP
jgi:Kef-type K+ transport system membrane component KefB